MHFFSSYFGVLPDPTKQAAETMTWNRTINIHGSAGRNIPMHQYNEFTSADINRILRDSSGRYTKEQISRTGHLAGPIGYEMDQILAHTAGESHMFANTHTNKENTQAKLVTAFVVAYENADLIGYRSKREHKHFRQFEYPLDIKDCQNYK